MFKIDKYGVSGSSSMDIKINGSLNADNYNNYRVEPIGSAIDTVNALMDTLSEAIIWHEQTEDGSDEAIKDIYGQETINHLNNMRKQVNLAKSELIKLRRVEIDAIYNNTNWR